MPSSPLPDDLPALTRWRLILGEAAQDSLGGIGGWAQADAAMEWLYGRERAKDAHREERGTGPGPSQMTVPDWINEIHTLFPREIIERLEHDAIHRYHLTEMITDPAVLERVEPDEKLLEAVLQTKHLMNPEVLAMARKLVEKVIRDLIERLSRKVKEHRSGPKRPRRTTRPPMSIDLRRTLRQNLHRWDPVRRRLNVDRVSFLARAHQRRHMERWQLILLVDQSGSMISSAIHSAVTAACFWGLRDLKTHLIAWDNNVVDLTDHVQDPVELLLKVNLGGGNDAAKALRYAAQLIENPRSAIVVLITDFYEGDAGPMVREIASLVAQGTKVLGLAALCDNAYPAYDKDTAARCAAAGARVGAMTPGELVGFVVGAMEG